MKAKIELSGHEVSEIIRKAMEEKFHVLNVTLEVGIDFEDRPLGSKRPVFKKAIVQVDL